jgi:hypothetical protein
MIITIDFIDGPYDGTVSFDESIDPSKDVVTSFAWSFYQRTKGRVGHWGCGLSPANQERLMQKGTKADLSHALCHEYHLIEAQETDNGLHLKAKYSTVPRGDEKTTWVIVHRRESEGRVTLALGGLPIADHEYRADQLVTIHTSIYQFTWGPPPDRATPLTGKKATWSGREYRIEKATIDEWADGPCTEFMPTLVLTVAEG